MSTTGNRIRELRKQNGLTLDDVAKHLGVGRQAIYKYEQGTVTNIPLENLEKMATLFGTTPGYLAGWVDTPPDDPLPDKPKNENVRLLINGINKLSPDQIEQLTDMMRIMFAKTNPDLFEKGNRDDHT